jgi:iron complex outermembrane receptor protein
MEDGEGVIVAIRDLHARLLAGTAAGLLGSLTLGATSASAQSTLDEVVVTAQKRAQNLQEVPVAVTALNQEVLVANRVIDVRDLNAVAANVSVRTTVGGTNIPSFTIRGLYAQAAAPGTDKGVSLYLDGVYLGNSVGSIFQLADIQQIEILKGPQGTLFGRNATGGAISIGTRDPTGEFGVEQTFSYGNLGQFRSKTRVDLPAWGPLSAAVTYLHNERHGEVKNLGAGTVWNFGPATKGRFGLRTSPKRLGDDNTEAVFAALKLEASPDLTLTYKFDYSTSDNTPTASGSAVANFDIGSLGSAGVAFYQGLFATQPNKANLTPVTDKRPKAVNNWFSTPGFTNTQGHNITVTWDVNDQVSIKNITSYRMMHTFGTFQLDSQGGLVNTLIPIPGALGQPMLIYNNATEQGEIQWSEEIIVNVDTKRVHVVGGYIHFGNRIKNGIPGLGQVIGLGGGLGGQGIFPGFVLTSVPTQMSRYRVNSDALYVQPEFHVTEKLDLVLGYRITSDKKTEHFRTAIPFFDSVYKKTRPTYLVGLNYKVNEDIFTYAKYSTGYISGGSVSGLSYVPELSESWEVGVKSDLFDNRLRSNLGVFSVKYRNLQYSSTGRGINRPELSLIIINAADNKSYGFEWENTLVPMDGLTLTGNLGYTHSKISNQNPALGPVAQTRAQYRPKWTGQAAAQYEIRDMPMGSRLVMRADANFRGSEWIGGYRVTPQIEDATHVPGVWILNARLALSDIKVANGTAEVALWGRNLTNDKHSEFGGTFPWYATAVYERARTYGVDVSFKF